jgi:integrase
VIYTAGGRTRWYTLGRYAAVKLEDARRLASDILLRVATGSDPQAERKAKRGELTFEELNDRYLEQHAKKMNKSWRQSDKQIRRNVLPRWAKLQASSIIRADVRALIGRIASPSVANLTLASVSAIFSFAMKEEIVAMNPCQLVDGHEIQSRERVLSTNEIPLFWKAFDSAGLLRGTALKLILLLGQRPGEVLHLRREHVVDGWWEMPGKAVPELNWPGTKNKASHRVWLPEIARDLLEEVDGEQPFKGPRPATPPRFRSM